MEVPKVFKVIVVVEKEDREEDYIRHPRTVADVFVKATANGYRLRISRRNGRKRIKKTVTVDGNSDVAHGLDVLRRLLSIIDVGPNELPVARLVYRYERRPRFYLLVEFYIDLGIENRKTRTVNILHTVYVSINGGRKRLSVTGIRTELELEKLGFKMKPDKIAYCCPEIARDEVFKPRYRVIYLEPELRKLAKDR